jgi:hypothetical protein
MFESASDDRCDRQKTRPQHVRNAVCPRQPPEVRRRHREIPQAACTAATQRRAFCRGARRPIGRLGCGMSAATAAVRPWSAQGHQDHHRGPAPRDMDEGFEAMTLSVPRCCCFALNISNLLSFFISTGMASKK